MELNMKLYNNQWYEFWSATDDIKKYASKVFRTFRALI